MSILALTSNTLSSTAGAGNLEYNGQFYATDTNASRAQLERIVQSTAVASTSGTTIDFTGIPAWAKRITIMFNGVSTNGSSSYLVQIGSGSTTITGYGSSSGGSANATTPSVSLSTAGFIIYNDAAASVISGAMQIYNISSNNWVSNHSVGRTNVAVFFTGGGNSPALSGTLDRVRITTVNGTDTFDAGSINIMYEG